ncbi:MAG: hypothetical protein LBQ13_01700 [Endomicrobium sp.]|jgi:predicted small secreted protein|nr:hypothetical protein [Endomicrobium sp.]
MKKKLLILSMMFLCFSLTSCASRRQALKDANELAKKLKEIEFKKVEIDERTKDGTLEKKHLNEYQKLLQEEQELRSKIDQSTAKANADQAKYTFWQRILRLIGVPLV